jgi:hypothetical protein
LILWPISFSTNASYCLNFSNTSPLIFKK